MVQAADGLSASTFQLGPRERLHRGKGGFQSGFGLPQQCTPGPASLPGLSPLQRKNKISHTNKQHFFNQDKRESPPLAFLLSDVIQVLSRQQ